MTGRTIKAEETTGWGLVNRIHAADDLLSEGLELAAELAGRPPEALRDTKRLSREVLGLDTDTAMTHMFEVIASRLRSDEHRAAVSSYVRTLGHRIRRSSISSRVGQPFRLELRTAGLRQECPRRCDHGGSGQAKQKQASNS